MNVSTVYSTLRTARYEVLNARERAEAIYIIKTARVNVLDKIPAVNSQWASELFKSWDESVRKIVECVDKSTAKTGVAAERLHQDAYVWQERAVEYERRLSIIAGERPDML